MRQTQVLALLATVGLLFLIPEVGYCSVESTMSAIQSKLVNVIMPLAAVLGLVWSAFSFFTGSPNARNHMWLAIVGAIVGFGAQSIIALIRGLVN